MNGDFGWLKETINPTVVKVYTRRWYILAIFSLLACHQVTRLSSTLLKIVFAVNWTASPINCAEDFLWIHLKQVIKDNQSKQKQTETIWRFKKVTLNAKVTKREANKEIERNKEKSCAVHCLEHLGSNREWSWVCFWLEQVSGKVIKIIFIILILTIILIFATIIAIVRSLRCDS